LEIEKWLKAKLSAGLAKFLWNFSVVCLNAPTFRVRCTANPERQRLIYYCVLFPFTRCINTARVKKFVFFVDYFGKFCHYQ
jgi:hypothetical protein